jgi:anti-sigma B factor antagonist
MTEGASKPVFLVDAYSDPVVVRLEGRACHTNCACLQDFFAQMMAQAKTRFVMDFRSCTSMDSTFLGVLAGVALELRRKQPPGSLVLCHLGRRNLEILRNLGLHRLLTVDAGEFPMDFGRGAAPLDCARSPSDLENAHLVLAAHENLVAADSLNEGRFEDVLAFLRNRVERESRGAPGPGEAITGGDPGPRPE